MLNVQNRKVIARLARRSLRAAKTRNCIAVLAIALTALLFTALFTIAGTIARSFEQETFRQVGGDMHGTFKDVTEAQMEDLRHDPRIKNSGARLMLGMPSEPPFHKAHVEVSYLDGVSAKGYFCVPTHGALPREETDEIACDTRILGLLGVEPRVGAPVTLTYELGNGENRQSVTGRFTLSGWWDYDSASTASMAIVPLSYAREVLSGYTPAPDDITGRWDLNVYLDSTRHIAEELTAILERRGFQDSDPAAANYIATGVNWAYLGAQLSAKADPQTLAALAGLLALIMLTGYLIIYNIFQISVTNDIRYYGLLKTIGVTGRQLRRIIRLQALTLCAAGIPLGLGLGWLAGIRLAPVVISTLSVTRTDLSANPLIFLGAALFTLLTVLISCRRPGRMAGGVSPVEAVRYAEGSAQTAARRSRVACAKPWRMALANLSRGKTRTALAVISLSLALVLLNLSVSFAGGFDMDKYLRQWVVSDFILGNASYFQTGSLFSPSENAVPQDAIDAANAQGISEGGRIYGALGAEEFVSETLFRRHYSRWDDEKTIGERLQFADRSEAGLPALDVALYGMEDFPRNQLTVLDGDLSALRDPSANAIAAVYVADDYGEPEMRSNWAKVGDTVAVRYVERWEYLDAETGEVLTDPSAAKNGFVSRAAEYRDVTYTVAATVTMRHSMSYRYYGSDEFVLNADVLRRDSPNCGVMTYLFNVPQDKAASAEQFLEDYTKTVNPALDYESKAQYVHNFEGVRRMFLLMGGALSFVIGLVGILNFLNAMLTSILTRRRELAMLQSIGMTGRQLKAMLMWEGLFYAVCSVGAALGLSALLGPGLGGVMERLIWFFTFRFLLTPVLLCAPLLLLFAAVIPLLSYRALARQSIVERLRETDA